MKTAEQLILSMTKAKDKEMVMGLLRSVSANAYEDGYSDGFYHGYNHNED